MRRKAIRTFEMPSLREGDRFNGTNRLRSRPEAFLKLRKARGTDVVRFFAVKGSKAAVSWHERV